MLEKAELDQRLVQSILHTYEHKAHPDPQVSMSRTGLGMCETSGIESTYVETHLEPLPFESSLDFARFRPQNLGSIAD